MMDPLVLILLFILFLLVAGLAVKSFRGNLKGDSILFIGLSQSGLSRGRKSLLFKIFQILKNHKFLSKW